MADRVGRERTKWCSGCHDPVVLFTGQMGAATQASFSYDSFEAQQGLTCMSCHSIAEVKDPKGNGAYVIEESKQYPFAFSENATLRAVNRLLIRMEPSLHRKTFMKPVHADARVLLDLPQGRADPGAERLPLDARPEPLRHAGTTRASRGARCAPSTTRRRRRPAATATCRPTGPTSSGTRRATSTTTCSRPRTRRCRSSAGTAETQKQIQDFLQDKVLTVDLFAIRRGGELLVLGDALPAVRPGETLDVEVVVRTRGVGHPYTNGTADSNETWVSLEADSGGRGFFASGVLDDAGRLDAAADRLATLVIDDEGGHMDRRQPQDIRVPLYNNGIGPGAARTVHYRITVPPDARGLRDPHGGNALPEVLARLHDLLPRRRVIRRCP